MSGSVMESLDHIKEVISQGEVDRAICLLDEYLHISPCDEAYYLLGNAYRKMSDWQRALNSYQAAIDLNPDSPATEARQMLLDILAFFNKDMYNQ